MSFNSFDDVIASVKQMVPISKMSARTTVANIWFSLFDVAGNPGAGVLAGTSTAVGVVPTDATAGVPAISFTTGVGVVGTVDFGNTVACRLQLCDLLFKAGAYAFTAATTSLSTQPSYSSRIPNSGASAADWSGTQIWIEVSTAFVTGNNWSVVVTYTNQAGTTGRSTVTTGAQAVAALTLGKMLQLALQSGDTGVQKIESVVVTNGATAMTAGAFNVLVLRPLWTGRVASANSGDCHGIDKTGMNQIWTDSCLIVMVNADSTSSGLPDIQLGIMSN